LRENGFIAVLLFIGGEMSELRKDPISGRWVIISVERGKRPTDFISPSQKKRGGFCPFCPGNEYTTPTEIMAFRPSGTAPNSPGWSLRVMSNKFPALQIYGELSKTGEGMFDKMNGVGAHEVIIETPDHLQSLSTIPLKSVEDALWAYYMRLNDYIEYIRNPLAEAKARVVIMPPGEGWTTLRRFCKERISFRYPLVELLTALLFVALFNRYGLSYDLFIFILFISGLIIATFVDIQHRIIPDEISVGGIILGFILTTIKGFNTGPIRFNSKPMLDSLLGIFVGGMVIYLTGKMFDVVYFKLLKKPPIQGETESMGGGDVKLLAMIGAFLGWQKVIFVFFLAPFFGAAIGIVNLLVKKDHTIPYGPFLSFSAIFSMFWMDKIVKLIFLR